MKKIMAAFVMAFAVLLSAPLAETQEVKVWRIGYLYSGTARLNKRRVASFRQGLQKLGYAEGKDIIIEERYGDGRREKIPALAAELVRQNVDVIVTHGASVPEIVNRAAREAGRTIPIVMAIHADPVGTGVVASLAHPGGNITGFTNVSTDLAGKWLELLKEVIPSASRVAVLWNPATTVHPSQWKQIQTAAQKMGVTLLSLKVSRPVDFDRALAAMKKEHPGGLVIFGNPTITRYQRRIVEFALNHRLPTVFPSEGHVMAGGLMSYGADFHDIYRRVATIVDKILKGAKPADLPVEQPVKFDLVINLKTAKKLGVTIPPEVLFRATKVIK